MENEERKIDISAKLMQMGQALIAEGVKSDDYTISQSGNVLIALSGVILSDEDMFLFSQFALMFTAKKMIDSMKGYDDTEAIKMIMKQKGLSNVKPPIKIKKPRGPKEPKDE